MTDIFSDVKMEPSLEMAAMSAEIFIQYWLNIGEMYWVYDLIKRTGDNIMWMVIPNLTLTHNQWLSILDYTSSILFNQTYLMLLKYKEEHFPWESNFEL